MWMRIEKLVAQPMLSEFLEKERLRVPTFYDSSLNLFIQVDDKNTDQAAKLIEWLVRQ